MTFQQMQCFIEVARCKNFTKAARTLYIAQPNLTKYIANMEKELGVKLFDRSSHHVELTPEGQSLLQRSEALFAFLLRAVEDVKQTGRTTIRSINIGFSRDETLPDPVFPLLKEMNLSRSVRIIAEQDTYAGLVSGLSEHAYDLIFTTDGDIRQRRDLESRPLRPFSLVLAVSEDHPKADRPQLTPMDFTDEKVFIALPNGKNVPSDIVSSVFSNCGGALDLYFGSSPSDIILNAMLRGGVAIVSALVDRKRYPGVRFVPFEERTDAFQYLVWRQDENNADVLSCRNAILAACGAETA